jgi:hypothetical protein
MAQKNSLRKHLDTKKRPTILLGALERHLLAQPASPRSTEVLHPSEICKSNWCPRESWFLLRGVPRPHVAPSFRMASVFSEGHGIHEKWQGWADEAGLLLAPEVRVEFPKWRIVGHADGILVVDGEFYLWEIKSIGIGTLRMYGFPMEGGLGRAFRNITRPFNEHIRQAMLYAYILRRTGGTPDLDKLLFLYECKEDQSAKEFVVTYNEEYLEGVLEKLASLFEPDDYMANHWPALVEVPPECTNGPGCVCEAYS